MVGVGAPLLDLRRTAMSFRDMNSKLKDFRSWSASNRKTDPGAMLLERENFLPSMLVTEQELRRNRESKTHMIKDSLWEKACSMLEAKRTERDDLREQLAQKTVQAQERIRQQVVEAAKQEEARLEQARHKRQRMEEEVSEVKKELSTIQEKVQDARQAEDEQVSRDNAHANTNNDSSISFSKRQKTDPKQRIAEIQSLLAARQDRLAQMGDELEAYKTQRAAEEDKYRENHAELTQLREQSKTSVYDAGCTVEEQVAMMMRDKQQELQAMHSMHGADDGVDAKRDAALKQLMFFLKDDAQSLEQMLSMEALLQVRGEVFAVSVDVLDTCSMCSGCVYVCACVRAYMIM
jgi:myosin heavy subunit